MSDPIDAWNESMARVMMQLAEPFPVPRQVKLARQQAMLRERLVVDRRRAVWYRRW